MRFILTYTPDYLYFAPGLAVLCLGLALLAILAGGPVTVGSAYLGIHFVALGAMLTLIGFNVLNLGVLAKATLARRYPGMRSRTILWLNRRYTLELGLIVGALLFAFGVGTDAWILVRRLATGLGPMTNTTHLAFVSTTSAVLGLNIVFGSSLLALILGGDGDND